MQKVILRKSNQSLPLIGRFFTLVTTWPKTVIVLALIVTSSAGVFIPLLTRNTSIDAFIPPTSPALIYRDKIKEIFGLDDPMVVAVINKGENGVFNPQSLDLIKKLTEAITKVPGIDPERVTSLATENNVVGTNDGMLVEPFYKEAPKTQEGADKILQAVRDFPLFMGSLVAEDGSGILIVAEMLDGADGGKVYEDLMQLLEKTPRQNEEFHVAGAGAASGYLGTYIDRDARRLNPIAGVIIMIILFLAYRTIRGILIPNLIVGGTVVITLGAMAAFGVPFFVITNALPVVLIGMAVADSIHIFSEYYQQMEEDPTATSQQLVFRALSNMWRPITLTSLTTIAGFAGLSLSTNMPPMMYFGIFAGIGVAAAWALTLTILPATLVLLKPKFSPSFSNHLPTRKSGMIRRLMGQLSIVVYHNTGKILGLTGIMVALGVWGALQLKSDDEIIRSFKSTEPIYQADQIIKQLFDGTNYLDVVIETQDVEDLFKLEHLQRIEKLQAFLETLPGVKGTTSVVDYIKQMNRALNEGDPKQYRLPEEGGDLIAQYFLLYSSSGDPTDFQDKIDYDYRLANVRATLNTGRFTKEKVVIDAVEQYIKNEFNTPEIKAIPSGYTAVHYAWLKLLLDNHFISVGVSLLLVILMTALSFRSLAAGLFASVPVAMAVLFIYTLMATFDIWLDIGTSMFAAISIGLGVDFAIHTLDQIKYLSREKGYSLEDTMKALYPSTGRALLFNFMAIFFGFGVLIVSDVTPLIRFGSMVGVGIAVSFIASLTVLPALIKALRPSFVFGPKEAAFKKQMVANSLLLTLIFIGSATVFFNNEAQAQTFPSGLEIAKKINAREDGNEYYRKLTMTLTDRRGKVRIRKTIGYRKYYGLEKRTISFFLSPRNVKGTAFLTFDYSEADRDDDQWLYLPALRKIRRISASNRGDYFLGTDFTYEEIKNETKLAIQDYNYKTLGIKIVNGINLYQLESTPKTAEIAKELGYSRVVSLIDPTIWMTRQADFWDVAGNHLKTIYTKKVKLVQNIWTAHRLEAFNHKTGHRTLFEISEVDYQKEVPDKVFTQRTLRRGLK